MLCNFNNYIFVLIICGLLLADRGSCAPKRRHHKVRDYSDDDYYSDDYDINYDQRQNGTENIRIVIDGVVVAVPGPDQSSSNDAISLLGGLFDEILGGINYDEDDLLTGEHQLSANDSSEDTSSLSSSHTNTNDKDKWPLYQFEQFDKSNSSVAADNKTSITTPLTTDSTGSLSPIADPSTSAATLENVTTSSLKESSKNANIAYGQKKQYGGGQRRRNKYGLASLLKPFLKRRSD